MENPKQKKLSFAILEILRQYTDPEHSLNQNDIVKILKKEYDIKTDRKSVKRNLTSLREMGFPIDFQETRRMYPNKDGIMEESFIQHYVMNAELLAWQMQWDEKCAMPYTKTNQKLFPDRLLMVFRKNTRQRILN